MLYGSCSIILLNSAVWFCRDAMTCGESRIRIDRIGCRDARGVTGRRPLFLLSVCVHKWCKASGRYGEEELAMGSHWQLTAFASCSMQDVTDCRRSCRSSKQQTLHASGTIWARGGTYTVYGIRCGFAIGSDIAAASLQERGRFAVVRKLSLLSNALTSLWLQLWTDCLSDYTGPDLFCLTVLIFLVIFLSFYFGSCGRLNCYSFRAHLIIRSSHHITWFYSYSTVIRSNARVESHRIEIESQFCPLKFVTHN